jgi:hypothetical protein
MTHEAALLVIFAATAGIGAAALALHCIEGIALAILDRFDR